MKKKDAIKTIITNFHTQKIKNSYERNIKLPINTNIIISVIGVRRSGKTYMLYETIKKLLKNNVPKKNILYINFEDERIRLKQNELDLILQAYQELYPKLNLENCHFFFDEIQNIQGWEKFVRRIFDTISTNIYITGSNSKLLSTDIATELRGRTISYTVYPLNFKEFLNFNSIEPQFYGTEQKNKVLLYSKKFLELGGFPEIVKLTDGLKIKKLQDYFNSIIYKDLIERYDISNPTILKFFIKKIFNNVTKPISVNKIYNELKSLGYKISNNVLYEYLEYIQATFTAVLVNKFSYSQIKQAKSEKKAYTIDCGFLTAIDYSFSENYGKLLENMIAMEILKAGKEIMFFKEKKECDFIIKDKNKLIPLQVSYSVENQSTKERELKGLYEACKFLNIKKGKIITFEEDDILNYKGIEVEIIPAYKFMLHLGTN